jgi:hypothetical protein
MSLNWNVVHHSISLICMHAYYAPSRLYTCTLIRIQTQQAAVDGTPAAVLHDQQLRSSGDRILIVDGIPAICIVVCSFVQQATVVLGLEPTSVAHEISHVDVL